MGGCIRGSDKINGKKEVCEERVKMKRRRGVGGDGAGGRGEEVCEEGKKEVCEEVKKGVCVRR